MQIINVVHYLVIFFLFQRSPSDEEAGHRSVIRPAALENHTGSNGHARPLGLNIDKPTTMSHNRVWSAVSNFNRIYYAYFMDF